MKYITIYAKGNDEFVEEFNTKEEAVAYADDRWDRLCSEDKKHCSAFYVLDSVNPDEDADNHFDGDVVKTYK